MQGPSFAQSLVIFFKLDGAASRMAFLDLNLHRECIRTGAAGARTRRHLGHHLLHSQILTDQISEILLCSVAELIGHVTKHAYLRDIKHFL